MLGVDQEGWRRVASIDLPFRPGLPIGNDWRPTRDLAQVVFPYDGSTVAQAPLGDVELARTALDAAVAVAEQVAGIPSRLRRDLLAETHERLVSGRHELEHLLIMETGKPVRDCRVEIERALLTLRLAAEESLRIHGETVPLDLLPSGDGLVGFYVRVPIGVVVGIAGFNYPLLLAIHKIAPALAAGCPVICKPAPQTPLATLWLAHELRAVASEIGFPLAAIQIVTGGPDVGATLTSDPRVGIVSFTGSAAVGHQIARDAAPRRAVLELGSNSALVVAEDADLQAAADAVVRGGFYASGQACISVQRVLVVDSVYEEFKALVRSRAADVVVGDPREEATQVSALINAEATDRVMSAVSSALAHGAQTLVGGLDEGLRPTILLDVADGEDVWEEEVFGPVLSIRSVTDVDAAITEVNRSRYGLHASVWTRSLAHTFNALRRLRVGGVVINDLPGYRSDTMPYGGVKDSGSGREGPRYAIEEFTVTRMAVIRP
jgi:acyl-CoA reductase-like NAD-dependent aldehyde dehydrogenase